MSGVDCQPRRLNVELGFDECQPAHTAFAAGATRLTRGFPRAFCDAAVISDGSPNLDVA